MNYYMATITQRLKEHMKKRMPRTYRTLKAYPAVLRVRLAGKIMPQEGKDQLEAQVRSLIFASNDKLLHAIWEALQLERSQVRARDFAASGQAGSPDKTEAFSSAEDMGMARAIALLDVARRAKDE